MSALDELLLEITDGMDEMDIANRLIDLRSQAAAELAELRERLRVLEAERMME